MSEITLRNDDERDAVARLEDRLRNLVDDMGADLPAWLFDLTIHDTINQLSEARYLYEVGEPPLVRP